MPDGQSKRHVKPLHAMTKAHKRACSVDEAGKKEKAENINNQEELVEGRNGEE